MSTYREIVYMVLDELKEHSDDAYYTEDHIVYIVNNIRAALLEKKYPTNRKDISPENYMEICVDLEEKDLVDGSPCTGIVLRSTKKIPDILRVGYPKVYPMQYFVSGHVTWVSMERFRYAADGNKWLENMIYTTRGTDSHLYLKSKNPQFRYLTKARIYAVFVDPKEAYEYSCAEDAACDILDKEFPLETNLIQLCIQMAVSELSGQRYAPEDKANNAEDDLAKVQVKR